MKRILTALLALLIASAALVSTALAEVVTVDLETATYEEIVAACELLKAERVARLKETFAETHEIQPLDGITFRGVPWGSTRAEAEAILGAPSNTITYICAGVGSVYTDGRGISTYYAGWTVAGYPVPTATLGFVYPVLEGKLLRDDSLAVMCSGMYEIQNIGDVNAVMDDLTTKLSALYGSYTHGSFNTRVWTDANGHSITLWPTDTSVYLLYYHADRDALMNAAVQAIADERAEQEELLRIQNQNNTDGL